MNYTFVLGLVVYGTLVVPCFHSTKKPYFWIKTIYKENQSIRVSAGIEPQTLLSQPSNHCGERDVKIICVPTLNLTLEALCKKRFPIKFNAKWDLNK